MQESRIKISSFQFTHHMRIMEHIRTNDPIPMFRFWSLLDNSNFCMSDIRYTFANDNNWKVLMLMISMIPSSTSSVMKHIALLWVIRKIPIFITNNMNWNRKKINVSGYSHNGKCRRSFITFNCLLFLFSTADSGTGFWKRFSSIAYIYCFLAQILHWKFT